MTKFDDIIYSYQGKSIDYDGWYGNQCVDLINQYLTDIGGSIKNTYGIMSAKNIWQKFTSDSITDFYVIKPTKWSEVFAGDIACYDMGTVNGHVAIITGYKYLMDENGMGNGDPCTFRAYNRYGLPTRIIRPASKLLINADKGVITVDDNITVSATGTFTREER